MKLKQQIKLTAGPILTLSWVAGSWFTIVCRFSVRLELYLESYTFTYIHFMYQKI